MRHFIYYLRHSFWDAAHLVRRRTSRRYAYAYGRELALAHRQEALDRALAQFSYGLMYRDAR